MDARMQSVIQNIAATRKHSFTWQRGEITTQPRFRWNGQAWHPSQSHEANTTSTIERSDQISLISWNIDFMRSYPDERMESALSFVQRYVGEIQRPVVIMLSEMLTSDLDLIQRQDWIRSQYDLTDVSSEFWESGYYGTCVLIPKSFSIAQVFRVHYSDTDMERDALFIDVNTQDKTVRLCCTHLESLIADPPKRPHQLGEAANFMRSADASILAGDLNAIQPFDKTLHIECGLKDAYLEHGGIEDDQLGMTWGQMAPTREREKFGLSRMDKVLYCGSLQLRFFETFGHDVVVNSLDQLAKDDGLEKPWVTDHLGVRADFILQNVPSSNLGH